MKKIFSDNSRKNKATRERNIMLLKKAGYLEAGCYSTSGDLHFIENSKGVKAVFGVRSNVGGKFNKYFSLVKYYKNEKSLNLHLKKIGLLVEKH